MNITVQDVMAHLTESICLPESTVDRLISGTPADEVQGIAVMWLASYAAIQQALQLGANLMITHEAYSTAIMRRQRMRNMS